MGRKRHVLKRSHAYALPLVIALPLVLNTATVAGTPSVAAGDSTSVADHVDRASLAAAPRAGGPPPSSAPDGPSLPGTSGHATTVTLDTPKGKRTVSESGLGVHDIPATAVRAYQRAAAVLAEVDPACRLPWTLLAAVGRIESNHGRYGGATLGTDGVSTPLIIGVPLDGAGPVAEIHDTDNGRFDGDNVWDRAVGPMQFIPSTWSVAGVDGDGDGARSPNDIDDAALAAAVYLCSAGGNLQAPAPMRSAIHRYNHSDSYVALVMAYEESYRTGDFTVTTPGLATAPGRSSFLEATSDRVTSSAARAKVRAAKEKTAAEHRKKRRANRTRLVAVTEAPTTTGTKQTPEPRPKPAWPGPPVDETTPKDPPKHPPNHPSPAPDPGPTPAPDPGPTPEPDPGPTPEPDPGPTPEPDPGPTPEPAPAPETTTKVGILEQCAEELCLDGQLLDVGSAELLTQPAAADFDGDGVTEDNSTEVAGLVGTEVTLTVDPRPTGWVVYAINDHAYRPEATA